MGIKNVLWRKSFHRRSSCESGNSVDSLHESIFFLFFIFLLLIPIPPQLHFRALFRRLLLASFSFFLFSSSFQHITPISHPICILSSSASSHHSTAHCHIFLIEKLSSSAPSLFRSHFSKCIFLKLFFLSLRCFLLSLYNFFCSAILEPSSSSGDGGNVLFSSSSEFLSFQPSLTSFSSWKHEKKNIFPSRIFFFFCAFFSQERKSCPKKGKDAGGIDLTLLLSGFVEFKIHLWRWTSFFRE